MIIYLETREIFLEHVRRNRIEEEVAERLKAIAGRRVGPSEERAWRNSLIYVSQFLQHPQIPEGLGWRLNTTRYTKPLAGSTCCSPGARPTTDMRR